MGNRVEKGPERQGGGGFTLVELIIVLALLGFIIAGVYQFFFYGQAGAESSITKNEVLLETNRWLFLMDNEVRDAVQPSWTRPSLEISSYRLVIYSDINQDTYPEKVIYQLDKGVLKRTQLPATNTSPPFSYGNDPPAESSDWKVVLHRVDNNRQQPAFTAVSGVSSRSVRQSVGVHLLVNSSHGSLTKPVELDTVLTVRSRQSTN